MFWMVLPRTVKIISLHQKQRRTDHGATLFGDHGQVVKRFLFSATGPTPQALRQAAYEDLALRGTTSNHWQHPPKE